MLAELLDMVYENYPEQPDWAAVQEKAYMAPRPVELITELVKAMFLYSEDTAAFDTFIYSLGE